MPRRNQQRQPSQNKQRRSRAPMQAWPHGSGISRRQL
jgi:hypothetical protein